MSVKFHIDGTLPTTPDAVFVFGSNALGQHIGGAAKVAFEKFGAEPGRAAGAWAFSYAIPSLDENFQRCSLESIAAHAAEFLRIATNDPNTEYFITRIGCVIAGFRDDQIAPLFRGAPDNCNFPEEWKPYVE